MEPTFESDATTSPEVVASSQATTDLAGAVADLAGAVAQVRDAASVEMMEAESGVTNAAATVGGIAATMVDEAASPVVKRLNSLTGQAAKSLTDAYQLAYAAGASPVIAGPDVAADIARGDYYASAVEQIIPDGASATAIEHEPSADIDCAKSPYADVCAPPAQVVPDLPPATEPLPAPETPASEPLATEPTPVWTPPYDPSAPAACPAPVIDVPACPIPAVVLVDRESGTITSVPGAYGSQGTGEPVTAPMPRPVGNETAPAPRPVAVPSQPAGGLGLYQPLPVTAVPVATQPMSGWDGPERCATIAADLIAGDPGPSAATRSLTAFVESSLSLDIEKVKAELASQTAWQPPAWLSMWSPTSTINTQLAGAVGLQLSNASPIGGPGVSGPMAAIGLAATTERATGAPFTYLAQGHVYDLQYASPQLLPTQEQVDGMRLSGTITRELWECLTKANGNKTWARELVIRSNRGRPNVGEWIALYRRGKLDLDGLIRRCGENGWTDVPEIMAAVELSEFVPPYSDIVRMMVRDSADEQAVAFGGFDSGFREKFAGPLKEWATANGISEDVFRYLWRAHWELPSPTQLYQMLHRLRPGRVDDGIAVTPEVVKQVLTQNDLAPGFVDRMMSVSYNTITRTDLMQWYVNGAIDEPELIERLQDNGYSLDDSKRIVEGWRVEKANRVQNRALLWTRRNITKHYIDGNVDRDSAAKLLSRSIPAKQDVQDVLDDADMIRKAERRRKCIRAVRRRMFTGDITEIETRRELVRLGLDAAVAADLAEGWTCEIAASSKEPTVKMLTGWLTAGVIDTNDFYHRLLNLRYSREDAQRILDTAIVHERKRLQALADKAAKELEARREKAAKELARQRDKAAKAAQQQQQRGGRDQSP